MWYSDFPYFLQPMFSTIEDIYVAQVDTDRGQKEKVHFFDTAGMVSIILSNKAMLFPKKLWPH